MIKAFTSWIMGWFSKSSEEEKTKGTANPAMHESSRVIARKKGDH